MDMNEQAIVALFEKFYQQLPEGTRLMNGKILSEVKDGKLILLFQNNMLAALFRKHQEERMASAGLDGIAVEYRVRDPQEKEERPFTKTDAFITKREDQLLKEARREFTFDEFVTGTSNEVVAFTCRALADDPSSVRLLFLKGPPACGKTHLIHAIANRARERGVSEKRIACIDARDFQGEYVRKANEGNGLTTLNTFYENRYGAAQFFLLDNAHFLTEPKTQERFIMLFDRFESANGNKALVVTSVASPSQVLYFSSELRSRLEKMVSLPFFLPDAALMIKIVMHKAQRRGLSLSQAAYVAIAAFAGQNTRKAEGALDSIRIIMNAIHISEEEAWERWCLYKNQDRSEEIAFFKVADAVASAFGMTKNDLLQGRRGTAALARKATFWLFAQINDADMSKLAFLAGEHQPKRMRDILDNVQTKMMHDNAFAQKMNVLLECLTTSDPETRKPEPF